MGKVSEGRKEARFQFIAENRVVFGVRYLCRYLSVSPAGFYKWNHRSLSLRQKENVKLTSRIRILFQDHDGNYGSPRIYQTLRNEGWIVNRKRVSRIMREEGLVGKAAKLYRRTALPENSCTRLENLRFNQPPPSKPNQQWAGDVSYLRVNNQWLYLSVILDLYSRKVIGWGIGKNRTTELTLASLEMALRERRPELGLIFHSDKGAEYASHSFQNRLRSAGIRPSMNRPKTLVDNIHVESFFRTFKTEAFHSVQFEGEDHLRSMTRWYLNRYYNEKRMHTSLGFQSPNHYERISA